MTIVGTAVMPCRIASLCSSITSRARGVFVFRGHRQERVAIEADVAGEIREHRPIGDGPVLREVGAKEAMVEVVARRGIDQGKGFGCDVGGNARSGLGIIGRPHVELRRGLGRRRSAPGLGVGDELLLVRAFGLGPEQERPPRDVDPVGEAFFQFVETDRRDVAPWSEKVGPDDDAHGVGHVSTIVEALRQTFPMSSCAFIGLGVMGYPMAGHLAAAGHEVTVCNRTATKAAVWAEQHGGATAPTPARAADGVELVFLCVGDDPDVRAVTTGDGGVLATMASGTVLVDHTTASADIAREIHAAAAVQGVGFVDAPVSGGQAGAENGVLTVMCGGEQEVFDRAAPVIDAYARAVTLVGGPGSGQLTKMVNQISIAGLLQGLSEGIDFAMRAGLDVDGVVDTISKGGAGSWQMENRATTMAAGKFDFGFALDWMRKDLGICLTEADRIGASLPVTALVDQFYARLQREGHGRWDTSSLIRLLGDRPVAGPRP